MHPHKIVMLLYPSTLVCIHATSLDKSTLVSYLPGSQFERYIWLVGPYLLKLLS